MEAKICCVVLALQIWSLVSATSRPFSPNDALSVHKPVISGQSLQSAQVPLGSKEGFKSMEGVAAKEEAYARGLSKLGSSPPSCDHKCYGCTPCEAIQVPTTSKRNSRLGINYANYEPEGWKCKCGPSFYSP
ncbi:hypothetical protein Tsubulata_028730 [Turnera subulata]|uniref:Epidermal patterning factor-like protein n=1 Tax=Turnera subulata TaxID=218843 RepID=A0A9Q0JRQ0_9ROSI|nr:hypothetical protein Tsubulata_028730 [Turnera subulata]